jgi:hypothetical protein
MFRQDFDGEVLILPAEFSPVSAIPTDFRGSGIQAFLPAGIHRTYSDDL